jgi:hypothetical protein
MPRIRLAVEGGPELAPGRPPVVEQEQSRIPLKQVLPQLEPLPALFPFAVPVQQERAPAPLQVLPPARSCLNFELHTLPPLQR